MYTNIPTSELITIIDKARQDNYVEDSLKLDIIKLSKIIIEQNHFQFRGETYIQSEGLAMGAPTSSIFSKFYLQHLEISNIYNLLLEHNIESYFHYVDDILIVYNENRTNIDDLLDCFNKLAQKIEFILERETDRKNNFLDINIYREPNNLSIDIYRKPTHTDVIIPNDSCHPIEHKIAVIRYLYNRMITYQLPIENMQKEYSTIQQILTNNKYDTSILNQVRTKAKQ
jgi:hypothetical protein